MQESSDARSRYLALALASRKVLRSIDTYVKTGQTDVQLVGTVNELVDSLKTAHQEANLFGPIPGESPFTNYEQRLTLDEVVSDLRSDVVIGSLTQLLSPDGDEIARKRKAAEAVKFFYTLENRALHHYSRQI